jgi:RNA polymerase sigma factor (sigma-70 family)
VTRDDDAHDQSDAKLLEELGKLRSAGVDDRRQREIIGLLIAGWYDRFFGYLAGKMGTEAAEEVAGRVQLELLRRLLRRAEFPVPWGAVVWRVVRDTGWEFIQERKARTKHEVAAEGVDSRVVAEPSEDPIAELDPERDAGRFSELVGELPERDQLVIRLRVIDEVPRAEAAKVLGINENAVDQARHRAIIRLAKLAKERGVSRPDKSEENEV